MSLEPNDPEKVSRILERDPAVTIFLRPIAAPAALGLAGFAGSTWITATWVANWWGSPESPTIFFPFVAFWGGLGQFIAGLYGYGARDTLITVVHVLWGSFWMSIGLLYLLVVRYTLILTYRHLYPRRRADGADMDADRLADNRGPPTPSNRRALPRTCLVVHRACILHLVRCISCP